MSSPPSSHQDSSTNPKSPLPFSIDRILSLERPPQGMAANSLAPFGGGAPNLVDASPQARNAALLQYFLGYMMLQQQQVQQQQIQQQLRQHLQQQQQQQQQIQQHHPNETRSQLGKFDYQQHKAAARQSLSSLHQHHIAQRRIKTHHHQHQSAASSELTSIGPSAQALRQRHQHLHHQSHHQQNQQHNHHQNQLQQQQMIPARAQSGTNQAAGGGDGTKQLDNLKPAHSYIGLIAMCILSTPEKRMVLNDIYQFILDHYPYYRNRGSGWRNSVRHNLSLNECFQKDIRAPNGKGHYWCIHPANMADFMNGDFRRRRAQRQVRRHNNMEVPSDESDDESMEDAARPPLPEHFKRSLEMHRQLELIYGKPELQHQLQQSQQRERGQPRETDAHQRLNAASADFTSPTSVTLNTKQESGGLQFEIAVTQCNPVAALARLASPSQLAPPLSSSSSTSVLFHATRHIGPNIGGTLEPTHSDAHLR